MNFQREHKKSRDQWLAMLARRHFEIPFDWTEDQVCSGERQPKKKKKKNFLFVTVLKKKYSCR